MTEDIRFDVQPATVAAARTLGQALGQLHEVARVRRERVGCGVWGLLSDCSRRAVIKK